MVMKEKTMQPNQRFRPFQGWLYVYEYAREIAMASKQTLRKAVVAIAVVTLTTFLRLSVIVYVRSYLHHDRELEAHEEVVYLAIGSSR